MTGIIVVTPPTTEQQPSSNSNNPQGLPGVTYQFALLALPQTWAAKQTFPLGNISVQAGDVAGLSSSATVDTTNASNISSGTLPSARLPNPTVSTLGGVQSIAAVSHNWISSISTSGVPTLSQPAFTDISGSVTAGQIASLPNPSSSTLGGIQSLAAVSHKWINAISTAGVPSATQPDAADVSFTQTGTGAVATTVNSKFNDILNARDFGAKFDGVTDDTAAIAAAIAATPSGGTLRLPAGGAIVSGSGTQIFTITTPINIVGEGGSFAGTGTTLKLATGVPSTRDLFHIVGVTNSTLRGYTFKNFSVAIVSGSGGQHVLHFDTTAGTTTGFAEVVIDNVTMPPEVSAGGNSVFLDNGTGTNTNGGTFNFTVQKCYIGGGVKLTKAGDTIRVLDNIITGANAGVSCDQVAGAGQLLVIGNNITATGGAVIVNQGIGPVIAFNEIECGATTEANNALVDINGSVASISSAKIFGNQIQGISGTPNCVRIGTATGAFIDGNRLSTAGTCIVNAAAASGTLIGVGNEYPAGTRLSEAGTGTIDPTGAWVTYTSTFAATTGTATVTAKKKVVGKTVFVNISVTFTSAVTGTFSVTLPANASSNAAISGQEIALSGVGAVGHVSASSNTLSVLSAAGGQFVTNGDVILLTGSYEST